MSAKPIVALDADGVIVDWYAKFLVYLNNELGTTFTLNQVTDHNFESVLGMPVGSMRKHVKKYYQLHPVDTLPKIPGAIEAIKQLAQHYEIIIITSRSEPYRHATHRWFKEHLPGVPIHFSLGANNPYAGGEGRKTKLEIAKSLGARYFIDDNPYEFDGWQHDHVTAICFKQPWNAGVKNVPRMDWAEIKNFLLKSAI